MRLTEELGANVGDNGRAYATTGAALLNQARISPLSDPVLASLVRSNHIARDAVYLIIDDPSKYARYRQQLALHFEAKTVRVLRASKPWIIEVRTQIDYFNATALGIPSDQIALAKRLGLLLVPRFQNDERYAQPQMEDTFNDVLAQDRKVSTVIFFGLRNQVFGYPDHLEDAAAVFREHNAAAAKQGAAPFNFGMIETYDDTQIQKGNDTLAKAIEGQTVRVQAIARTELDKITLDDVVARYVLGVRERNIRVVYLRPWAHQDGNLSIEATNVEMVKEIGDQLKAHSFKLGRATPIPQYRGNNRILVGDRGARRPFDLRAAAGRLRMVSSLAGDRRLRRDGAPLSRRHRHSPRHLRAIGDRACRRAALCDGGVSLDRRPVVRNRRRAFPISSCAVWAGPCSHWA